MTQKTVKAKDANSVFYQLTRSICPKSGLPRSN